MVEATSIEGDFIPAMKRVEPFLGANPSDCAAGVKVQA
jgi:hypothetical protein